MTKFYLRGDATEDNLYTVSGKDYIIGGNKVSDSYPVLYAYEGDGQYSAVSTSNMYYKKEEKRLYTVSLYASAGKLYKSGGSTEVYVQPDSPVSTDLFKKGTEYSGGLYTGYKKSKIGSAKKLKPASVTTENVVALTV